MKKTKLWFLCCAILIPTVFTWLIGHKTFGAKTIPARLPSSVGSLDFVTAKVCVDPSGNVQSADPYDCPTSKGYSFRSLRVGERLPYHKHDQRFDGGPEGDQRHDSFPIRDAKGHDFIVSPFDSTPFGIYKPWNGHDIFVVRDGWVSAGETRDKNGLSTSFFGSGCQLYNGWVFFPAGFDPSSQPGRTKMAINADHWELNGENWPGACPSFYDQTTVTSWEFISNFEFGGVNGARKKNISTIVSTHGFEDDPKFPEGGQATQQFLTGGHLEVFYFTQLYGITRWEVWTPNQQLRLPVAPVERCLGLQTKKYGNVDFSMTDCRDWSDISVVSTPEAPPVWPIPDTNILQNFHFADISHWDRSVWNGDGSTINLALKQSDRLRDKRFSTSGVRYLTINCNGHCSSDKNLFQEIPVTGTLSKGIYTFGATVRTERGDDKKQSGDGRTAKSDNNLQDDNLQIGLVELDSAKRVIKTTSFAVSVKASSPVNDGSDSVVLSSSFANNGTPLTLDSKTALLRFTIAPMTENRQFEIIESYVLYQAPSLP